MNDPDIPKITNLAELRAEKRQLRIETQLLQADVSKSLSSSRTDVSTFLVQKVVIPVGLAGLGLYVVNKMVTVALLGGKRKIVRETRVVHERPDPAVPVAATVRPRHRRSTALKAIGTVVSLGKLAIPIIQAIIGSVHSHRAEEAAKTAKRAAVSSKL